MYNVHSLCSPHYHIPPLGVLTADRSGHSAFSTSQKMSSLDKHSGSTASSSTPLYLWLHKTSLVKTVFLSGSDFCEIHLSRCMSEFRWVLIENDVSLAVYKNQHLTVLTDVWKWFELFRKTLIVYKGNLKKEGGQSSLDFLQKLVKELRILLSGLLFPEALRQTGLGRYGSILYILCALDACD